ncbi:hypothetical protein BJ170DRAFT_324629 [Xylariales sp. AK1849]|nr:hypothetical protein BJ170DRAFT_324629 [Xylariales sp. AK1849]
MKPQGPPDPAEAESNLQFIHQEITGISKSARRTIRSHVMRSKNAGRPRRSTRKQTKIIHIGPNTAGAGCLTPQRLLWNDLSLTSFPQQVDLESTKLIHRWFLDISDKLFPPQFCSKYHILKSIWVNCVLADKAYFHAMLAISASYVDFFERKPRTSLKALCHISQAYSLANLKLSSFDPISDNALAAVVTLVIYQQIHDQYTTGLIHLKGLCKMIQVGGGVGRLMQENRTLALKALRTDAELTLKTGLPTTFNGGAVSTILIRGEFDTIKEKRPSHIPGLPPVMFDIIIFAHLLNIREKEDESKLDPLDYTETVLSLLYRLVGTSRYTTGLPYATNICEDVAHLALLPFMTTLLPEYARDRPSNTLLSNRLDSIIYVLYTTTSDTENARLSLLLWALFIGGISVSKSKDQTWISIMILETCERLELHDWHVVHGRLSHLPWINSLHSAPGRCLWELSQRTTTGGSLNGMREAWPVPDDACERLSYIEQLDNQLRPLCEKG